MLYHSLLRPLLFRLPPETAHELALHSLATAPGIVRRLFVNSDGVSEIGDLKRFGLTFANPVGLAAGFDKDGIALQGLAALGFGHIEAGTVTYHAQPGNPRPRLFRLPDDLALINRAGFNNHGAAAFAQRAEKYRPDCVLGVSIGKSKIVSMEEAVADYLRSFEIVYPVADYIAVNVSSPNTPGLRSLQQARQLFELLNALQQKNRELSGPGNSPRPLLVKLSPDLGLEDLESIVEVIRDSGAAGIIATNTTTTRDHLRTHTERVQACGEGGLSGAPLRQQSCRMLGRLYRLTQGVVPLVGVGGIFNAHDAWQKITAGASLVQIYTGFIYEGPGVVNEINRGLGRILKQEGLKSLDEAVGIRAGEFE